MNQFPITLQAYVEIDGPPTTPFSAGDVLLPEVHTLPRTFRTALVDLVGKDPDDATCDEPDCAHGVGWTLTGDEDSVVWAFTVLITEGGATWAVCEDHHPGTPTAVLERQS